MYGQGYVNQSEFQDPLAQSMVGQGQAPPFKNIITTEDIREIVQRLNQKPFNESYSLVTFDELTAIEMLELLNKIFVHLDSKWTIDIRNDNQDNIIYKISESLKILNFPSQFDQQWQNQLLNADKKTVYPIFYFLLSRLPDCEKRAYLARFLMPLQIPEEFMVDNEIKTYLDQYKDLQAEFQVYHQQFEAAQKESMNPTDLKREITQLEQEKEQLVSKITIFKNKNTNKPQFQALLEVTNLLRREQEEEARLQDKLRQQRQQLEWTDQQLLSNQQRLLDAKKSLSPDNTPEQMLQSLRNEVKKNRELSRDRLGLELKEKRKKIEQIERVLSEPPVTMNELNQMENYLMGLRRTVNQMEDKLRREAKPEDDKLAIYKQQAQLVTKKKERIIEDLKKIEEQFLQIDKDVQKKEEQLNKERGPGYKSKDEFKQYANELREKTAKFKKMKEELKVIQVERVILERTEVILKKQKSDLDAQLKVLEQQHGIMGFHSMREGLEKISEQKGEIDDKKGKTLEEISRIVTEIQNQCNIKKPILQNLLKDLKDLRKTFQDVELIYNQKKSEYDRVVVAGENDQQFIASDLKKLRDEVYGADTKISLLKYQTEILDTKINRMNNESEFTKGTKQLSKEYKSNTDMLNQRFVKLEIEIKELRQQREVIKENHEPSLRQMGMYNELQKLLQLKLQITKNDQGQRNKDKGDFGGTTNRLVIN